MFLSVLKTTLLFAILTAFLLAVCSLFGISPIAAIFLVGVLNFGIYWLSDSFVLWVTGARVVSSTQVPDLYSTVNKLARAARIPMPKVAIVNNSTPNAFATGRSPSHAVVCVHTGLLGIMNADEVEGVLSHELTHVRNWDTLTSVVAATLAGAISYIARWGWFLGGLGGEERGERGSPIGALLMMIFAPIAALLIQLAISRTREYAADEGGARLSGKPEALASALLKIENWVRHRPMQGNPAFSNLYIVNPFRGSTLLEIFSTHPPTEKRVARLRKIAQELASSSG